MTYQEKYAELFRAYDSATKAINSSTQKIAFTNGFGDTGDLENYLKSNSEYTDGSGNVHTIEVETISY